MEQLRSIAQLLTPLAANLNDTIAKSGSSAYQGALAFYRHLKNAKRLNVKNAALIYKELAEQFTVMRRKSTSDESSTSDKSA